MNDVKISPIFKTDLYLNYEGVNPFLGKWHFVNKDEFGRKFNVVIGEGGVLTTREMNRISTYNATRDEQGYDDLDIVSTAWEQCVLDKQFNDNENIKISAKMNDGIIYNLELHVYSISKSHFHFIVDLL